MVSKFLQATQKKILNPKYFIHEIIPIVKDRKDEIFNVATNERGRFYQSPSSKEWFPSVTTVLSEYSKESIEGWKKFVGIKEANIVSKSATKKGTAVHQIAEDYLNNKVIDVKKYSRIELNDFNSIKKYLDKYVDIVIAQEIALCSETLKVAGRVDLVIRNNNRLKLLDFKTASGIKEDYEIHAYFLQMAAYASMWNEFIKDPSLFIEEAVIVMTTGSNKPLIFEKKTSLFLNEFNSFRELFNKNYGV